MIETSVEPKLENRKEHKRAQLTWRELFNWGEIWELTQTLIELSVATRRARMETVSESGQSERIMAGLGVLSILWVSLKPNKLGQTLKH